MIDQQAHTKWELQHEPPQSLQRKAPPRKPNIHGFPMDQDACAGCCNGPCPIDGRIYLGSAGSDVGAVGHMMAFDIKNGDKVWNFDVVPLSGPGADSWPADAAKTRAGGGMYSSFALDTKTGRLCIPTGNPGPDFASSYRPGANLYTSSVVNLDAKTGAMKAHYQVESHDVHDRDIAASPMLFTGDFNGELLAFDAATGRILFKDRAGGPIGGGVITYAVGGRQYVVVAAGMKNAILEAERGPASVVIYALPGKQ